MRRITKAKPLDNVVIIEGRQLEKAQRTICTAARREIRSVNKIQK